MFRKDILLRKRKSQTQKRRLREALVQQTAFWAYMKICIDLNETNEPLDNCTKRWKSALCM